MHRSVIPINILLVVVMVLIFIFNDYPFGRGSVNIFPHTTKNYPDILRNPSFPHRFVILAILKSKLLYMCLSVHIVLINMVLLCA